MDCSLSGLWQLLVRSVGGDGVQPVDFAVDWDEFRQDIALSLRSTAYERYDTWIRSKKKLRGEEAEYTEPKRAKRAEL